MNRAARAGKEVTPEVAISLGTDFRAREIRESEVEEPEEEEGVEERRWSAESSLAKGRPASILCSSALTAVKILRARTASPRT